MKKTVQINALYLKLVKQALKDGIISDDENKVLVAANEKLKDFKKVYEDAWEDEVISDFEKKLLTKTKDQIITHVTDVANSDEVVSEEEKALLKILENVIEQEIQRSINIKKTYTTIVDI